MTNSLKTALETLLRASRNEVDKIYENEEFLSSNLPLDGWIFLKLTASLTFTKAEKYLNDDGMRMLTEGARQISMTVAEEFYKESNIENTYHMRILNLLRENALYAHECAKALGLSEHGLNTVQSVLAYLEAKSKIYRDKDFRYRITEVEE